MEQWGMAACVLTGFRCQISPYRHEQRGTFRARASVLETQRLLHGGEQVKPKEIVQLRRKLRLTQHEFARRLSVTQAQLSRWETGQAKPRSVYVRQLREMAGLPVEVK